MMLLTIAIPCYNGSADFQELFLSIENLGLKESEYEVLIVDNHSEDGTDEQIRQLQAGMPNLRYYRNEQNIGRIENWNKAIALSRGEFLILMNVNDRFLQFDARRYLNYLLVHPEVAMVLTDMEFKDGIYPDWEESGVIGLKGYLQKTFLDDNYLEFHAVGVLHQHIFRTQLIKDHKIRFDPKLPRTTDRVFVGALVSAGGGLFLYTNKTMVKWQLNTGRYHYQVHMDGAGFNFQELWVNEYEANLKLSRMGDILFEDFLKSQLVLSSSYRFKMNFINFKMSWLRRKEEPIGLEFPTAHVYYAYLSAIASIHKIPISHASIKLRGLLIVLRQFLIHHHLLTKPARTIKSLFVQQEQSPDPTPTENESIIYNRQL